MAGVKVYIDGNVAFDARVQFHPDSGYEYVGYSPFDAAFGSKFTGQIKEVKGISLKNFLRAK